MIAPVPSNAIIASPPLGPLVFTVRRSPRLEVFTDPSPFRDYSSSVTWILTSGDPYAFPAAGLPGTASRVLFWRGHESWETAGDASGQLVDGTWIVSAPPSLWRLAAGATTGHQQTAPPRHGNRRSRLGCPDARGRPLHANDRPKPSRRRKSPILAVASRAPSAIAVAAIMQSASDPRLRPD